MNEKIKNFWPTIKELIFFTIWVAIIVLPIRMFIAQPFVVSGQSMDPTLHNGQYLIVDQITYRISEPQRGDVVIFRLPADPKRFLIKRLIGLPGETIKIDGESIYIKNTDSDYIKLDEDFIIYPKAANLEQTLSSNEYFLLGDNRANSLDSRFFGSIEREYLVGRALIRLFPIEKINWLPGKFNYNY